MQQHLDLGKIMPGSLSNNQVIVETGISKIQNHKQQEPWELMGMSLITPEITTSIFDLIYRSQNS